MQNSLKMKLAFTALIMVLLCQPWQSGVYACGNIRYLCKKEWDTCAEPSTNSGMVNAVVKLYIQVCCRVVFGLEPSETRLPQSHRRSVTEESTEMRGDLRAFFSGTRQETIDQDSSTDSKSNTESSEAAGVCSQLLSECKTHVTPTEISTYLDRVESEISFSSAFSEVGPMLELVGQTNSRDSNLGLISESPSENSSDIETNVEVPIAAMTSETEIPMALRTTPANERECVEDASQDSSVTVPREAVGNVAESYTHGTFARGELHIISTVADFDLQSSTRSEPVGQINARDSDLEKDIATSEAASSDSEIPPGLWTYGTESPMTVTTAHTDGWDGVEIAGRDEEYPNVSAAKKNEEKAAESGSPGDKGELDTVSEGMDKVDEKIKPRHEQDGQTNPRYTNLELNLESFSDANLNSQTELSAIAASEESETDVKIPFNTGTDEIESYTNLNAGYTDGREGGDHLRRQHGYSSVTVPKELNFVAESYHRNALSRGEPDGQSSNDDDATAPSVPTWSVVTADGYREYREYRHRYTEEWLTFYCPSSMEVMFNSSSNMNDNQTSLHDSIDSDELFGSGQG